MKNEKKKLALSVETVRSLHLAVKAGVKAGAGPIATYPPHCPTPV